MKTILLSLALISFSCFSQDCIEFTILNGKPTTTGNLTNLKLPACFSFSKDFNGKSVAITNTSGQTVAGKVDQFGSANLSKDGNTGKFLITIGANRMINPGDGDNMNFNKFLINIGGNAIAVSIDSIAFPIQPGGGDTSANYAAGYLYYDALKLADPKTAAQSKIAILKAYQVDLTDTTNNPILNSTDALDDYFTQNNKSVPQGMISPTSFLSGLGSKDITYLAAGVAQFLAERTREELNEAFFSKMQQQLNAYPELLTLFPKTATIMNAIDNYSYASVLQVLKDAFEADIHNLPANLYEIKDLTSQDCDSTLLKQKQLVSCEARMDQLQKFFNSKDGRWIGLAMFAVKEASESSNPANLLKAIAQSAELDSVKKISRDSSYLDDFNAVSAIKLGNFISQSLLSKDAEKIWVDREQLGKLFETKEAFEIYLGLMLASELVIHEKDKIKFFNAKKDSVSFGNLLKKAHETEAIYATYKVQIGNLIKSAHSAFNSANSALKQMELAMDKSAEADPQALYTYYQTFNTALGAIANNAFLEKITGKDIGAGYAKIEPFLTPSADLVYHIAVKKYSSALYDAVMLLNNSKSPALESSVAQSFIKYGTLISTVANAQSSEEVQNAIEASALPAGSYAIKRNSAWSIELNGYVGAFYGEAKPVNKSLKPYNVYGLYAPIGLSFNRGIKCGTKAGWGFSVITQVVDLGALVNFYLLEGDQTALPSDFKVTLSNVFAPGAQLGINIPRTPITLTCGGQFVPALYSTDQITEESNIVASSAWRWQASAVVDIPLYNIKVWDFRKKH